MRIDSQGHIRLTPRELYERALDDPVRLINDVLLVGTPVAFARYSKYCDFLHAVSERTGVHPRNLLLRGSCHLGFSIAPRPKVWTAMSEQSDLDLAIVDADYFHRIDQEVQRWEANNKPEGLQGDALRFYLERQQYRHFNCCSDRTLPRVVCVHHKDAMKAITRLHHCGLERKLTAFIFRDWWAVRARFEHDLEQLCRGVEARRLTAPGDEPLPPERTRSPQPQPEPTAAPAVPSVPGSTEPTTAAPESVVPPEGRTE